MVQTRPAQRHTHPPTADAAAAHPILSRSHSRTYPTHSFFFHQQKQSNPQGNDDDNDDDSREPRIEASLVMSLLSFIIQVVIPVFFKFITLPACRLPVDDDLPAHVSHDAVGHSWNARRAAMRYSVAGKVRYGYDSQLPKAK